MVLVVAAVAAFVALCLAEIVSVKRWFPNLSLSFYDWFIAHSLNHSIRPPRDRVLSFSARASLLRRFRNASEEELASLQPSAAVHLERGWRSYVREDNTYDAEQHWRRAVEADPSRDPYTGILALAFLSVLDHDDATRSRLEQQCFARLQQLPVTADRSFLHGLCAGNGIAMPLDFGQSLAMLQDAAMAGHADAQLALYALPDSRHRSPGWLVCAATDPRARWCSTPHTAPARADGGALACFNNLNRRDLFSDKHELKWLDSIAVGHYSASLGQHRHQLAHRRRLSLACLVFVLAFTSFLLLQWTWPWYCATQATRVFASSVDPLALNITEDGSFELRSIQRWAANVSRTLGASDKQLVDSMTVNVTGVVVAVIGFSAITLVQLAALLGPFLWVCSKPRKLDRVAFWSPAALLGVALVVCSSVCAALNGVPARYNSHRSVLIEQLRRLADTPNQSDLTVALSVLHEPFKQAPVHLMFLGIAIDPVYLAGLATVAIGGTTWVAVKKFAVANRAIVP